MDATQAPPQLSAEDGLDRGFSKWFNALPNDPQVIRFFDRKDFYSAHGENALFIARTFYKSLAVIKHSATGLPSVTLNRNLFETALHHLLMDNAEHIVQLFEGSGAHWRKTREASPGKLGPFEEELFRNAEMLETPVVATVLLGSSEGARSVGVAYADAAGRRLGACEFADDEYFCSTEAVLLQLGAKEVALLKAWG